MRNDDSLAHHDKEEAEERVGAPRAYPFRGNCSDPPISNGCADSQDRRRYSHDVRQSVRDERVGNSTNESYTQLLIYL